MRPGRTFGIGASFALAAALAAAPAHAQTQVNVVDGGNVSVDMYGCSVLFNRSGRVLNEGRNCSSVQLREARNVFESWQREQGGDDGGGAMAGSGPEWFVVSGVRNNNLGLMDRPSLQSGRFIAEGIRNGTRVRSLGCERSEGDEWCRIEVGRDVGWARRTYLAVDDRGGSSYRPPSSRPTTSSREDADWFRTEGARNNLEVMDRPSMRGRIVVDGIRDGTSVRNLGCERHESDTWCEIEVGRDRGWARIRYLQPDDRRRSSSGGATGLSDRVRSERNSRGEEYFQVEVSGRLRLKATPSTDGRNVLENVPNGTVVRSLGCERHGGESWCRVEVDREVGWIRERWLRPY